MARKKRRGGRRKSTGFGKAKSGGLTKMQIRIGK
jgi:hypothetical protein